uniref:Uncharacterized protein n=1 Tax=Ascaris lumbricoides TaxID=6252 RepID=A0A0M3ITM6_ASCLU
MYRQFRLLKYPLIDPYRGVPILDLLALHLSISEEFVHHVRLYASNVVNLFARRKLLPL